MVLTVGPPRRAHRAFRPRSRVPGAAPQSNYSGYASEGLQYGGGAPAENVGSPGISVSFLFLFSRRGARTGRQRGLSELLHCRPRLAATRPNAADLGTEGAEEPYESHFDVVMQPSRSRLFGGSCGSGSRPGSSFLLQRSGFLYAESPHLSRSLSVPLRAGLARVVGRLPGVCTRAECRTPAGLLRPTRRVSQ